MFTRDTRPAHGLCIQQRAGVQRGDPRGFGSRPPGWIPTIINHNHQHYNGGEGGGGLTGRADPSTSRPIGVTQGGHAGDAIFGVGGGGRLTHRTRVTSQ